MEMQYASNAKGNAALTTGIIGTAGVGLSLLQNMGGLLGGNTGSILATAIPTLMSNCGGVASKYALEQSEILAKKDAEIMSLKTSQEMDSKMLELYKELASKDKAQSTALSTLAAEQAVTNQKLNDQIGFITHDYQMQIAAEANARKQADNTIVNYINSTFYPQQIAAITTGSTTSTEKTYNPLICNCNCNN